jgi:Helix-turn-helix domain
MLQNFHNFRSMIDQLDIFIHQIENNPESQCHLNENKKHFSDQCKKVLALLKDGVRLTTINAVQYGILSLPRRIKDLKDFNGIEIKERWLTDPKIKEWYL